MSMLNPALHVALAQAGLATALDSSHPHLFSPLTVEITGRDLNAMQAIITAAERAVATPGYVERALAAAPTSAQHDPHTPAVCTGYDFHLTPDGPRLIEINTNAGGALLALARIRAQLALEPARALPTGLTTDETEEGIVAMFRHAWQAARGDAPLRTLAIVDDAPEQQYLHPEFLLYRALFTRHGIEATIADAAGLRVQDRQLHAGERAIDFVYNRVTDFALSDPTHAALHDAYMRDLAVVSPHPRAHALYAAKHNLALLSDPQGLQALGLDADTRQTLLRGIPLTRRVNQAEADALWGGRKQLFFKPLAGYGSKAVYRGDKLTRRVWEEILAADYVAQTLAMPAELSGADGLRYKFDVRAFVDRGRILLLAARLYQGQTTNFRTPGGGFAPVFVAGSPAAR